MILTILLVAVFLVIPIEWLSAIQLVRIARSGAPVKALNERALAAIVIAFGTTVYFVAALNAATAFPWLDQGGTQLVARVAVASIAIAPLRWLWLYEKGGF